LQREIFGIQSEAFSGSKLEGFLKKKLNAHFSRVHHSWKQMRDKWNKMKDKYEIGKKKIQVIEASPYD
jgi:hypothetical protein